MTANHRDDDAVAAETGADRTTISRLRRGKQRPSWPLAEKIAKLTGGQVTADSFMQIDGEAEAPASEETEASEESEKTHRAPPHDEVAA